MRSAAYEHDIYRIQQGPLIACEEHHSLHAKRTTHCMRRNPFIACNKDHLLPLQMDNIAALTTDHRRCNLELPRQHLQILEQLL